MEESLKQTYINAVNLSLTKEYRKYSEEKMVYSTNGAGTSGCPFTQKN